MVSSLSSFVESVAADKQRNMLSIDKEFEIAKLRCKQHFEILNARLSAYWTGVLAGDARTQSVSPIFNIDNMLDDIKLQLECFDKMRGDTNG